MALLLGGGTRQGLWSDAVVQLAALVLLAFLSFFVVPARPAAVNPWPLALVGAAILLPLLQLVPLPPWLWAALPGRAPFATAYGDAGIDIPWQPLSLDRRATWRCLLALLPPIAVFLSVARLDLPARRSLSLVLIAIVVGGVLLGLAQLMQGPQSPLRFFPVTNVSHSVGFFANRNHYAALLYSLIPFTAAWMLGLTLDRRPERHVGLAACVLVYALLLLGLGLSLSRAGVSLALVATLLAIVIAARTGGLARRGLAIVLVATALGGVLVVQFAFLGLADRFDTQVLDDYRLTIAATALEAARAFFPVGSGLGTFDPVYRMFEAPDALIASYVNHAHNDWLELWLEGGVPAMALVVLFLGWFAVAAARVWRLRPRERVALDRALAQAAAATAALLLLHSAVDYPLRTTALSVLFAYCCGLLTPPPDRPRAA